MVATMAAGFYEYAADGSKAIWPPLFDLYYQPDTAISELDMKRPPALFRPVIESLKCLKPGLLRAGGDGNIGSIMWVSARRCGPAAISSLLIPMACSVLSIAAPNALAQQYGERFPAAADRAGARCVRRKFHLRATGAARGRAVNMSRVLTVYWRS